MLPYQKIISLSDVPSGQDSYFKIPAPGRGWMHRLKVIQDSGSLDGYAFELYMRDVTDASISGQKDLYSFFGELAVASGSATGEFPLNLAETILSVGAALAYVNEDDSSGISSNYLMLRLNPSGTGNKNFRISLTCSAVTPY